VSGPDKRKDERVSAPGVAIRVRFTDANDLEQYFLRDISRGGIFLRAKNLKPLHSHLFVVLALPDGGEVKLKAEVVHVVTAEEAQPSRPAGMGVQFLDMTPEVKQRLAEYIDRLKGRAAEGVNSAPAVESSAQPAPPSAAAPAAAAPAPPPARSPRPTPMVMPQRQPQPTPHDEIIDARPGAEPTGIGLPRAPARAPVLTPPPIMAPPAERPVPVSPLLLDPEAAAAEFDASPSQASDASAQAYEEENDVALLRRLCWLMAEGGLLGRPVKELFGVPAGAPAVLRREVYERMRKALAPERPPAYLGAEEARAIARALALLESLTEDE
jgi:uncharacterized protein (TIGR02266 family)